jgi:hypothetical protein
MFVPITSEINIEKGMVLKEIATGQLFEIGNRIKEASKGWGDDPWELRDFERREHEPKAVAYNELAEKYLAEVEE